MGANRSGTRARQKMKRHKKEMERLARKAAAAEGGTAQPAAAAKPAGK
jgi:hypothetical protein